VRWAAKSLVLNWHRFLRRRKFGLFQLNFALNLDKLCLGHMSAEMYNRLVGAELSGACERN